MNISRAEFIGEVTAAYDGYYPNEEVAAKLGAIDLTTISGPTGMGKDTVIEASRVPRVISDTIREPQLRNNKMETDGHEYFFRCGQLDSVLGEVQHGDYVQYELGPGGDSFYGSRLEGYPSSGPAVMDVMAAQIKKMRALPFKSVGSTFVVAPSFDIWIGRTQQRGPLSDEDWAKRYDEAQESIELALEDESLVFIINDAQADAGMSLRLYARLREYNPDTSSRARDVAYTILSRLVV